MNNPKKKETGDKETLQSYFKGVKSEWGKVTWPERKQVISETFVVLGVVTFFTVFVYLIDVVYSVLLQFIPHR